MSFESNTENITSPCIGVCTMSESSGFCLGCYRTIEEIKQWWDLSPDAKLAVMQTLTLRQTESDANINFDN